LVQHAQRSHRGARIGFSRQHASVAIEQRRDFFSPFAEQLDAEVKKLTDSICAKSPVALAMGKQMFYRQIEMGLDGAYQLAAETMACNMMAHDAAEGIDAFMQKRKPEWKGC
jgi:enoyl-CoA hydratase/carnithine racemase